MSAPPWDEQPTENEYWLDDEDRIVYVAPTWDAFASGNDGDEVVASRVVGQRLWEFISGDTTRMWVESVLQLSRLRKAPVERTYRCDSPTERRYMSMRATPMPKGILRVQHVLLSVDPRSEPVYIRPAIPDDVGIVERCSICGRISADSEVWHEPDAPQISRPDAFLSRPVVYTVCASCRFT